MEIHNKVKFLKPYFLITKNKPPNINILLNIQIEYEFLVDF